jgi:hypothetical protein
MSSVLQNTSILAIYGLWKSSEIVLLTNRSQYVLLLQITRATFVLVFVMPNGAIRIKIPPFDSALEIVLITDVKLLLNNSILAIYGLCLWKSSEIVLLINRSKL